jgi:predicted NAD-dependent protein-ADP-ribosyltransferase YbiA (DUF1768 family)
MQLSEALVLAKTKVEAVEHVRNLNLWGNGLTDVSVSARPDAGHGAGARRLVEFYMGVREFL